MNATMEVLSRPVGGGGEPDGEGGQTDHQQHDDETEQPREHRVVHRSRA